MTQEVTKDEVYRDGRELIAAESLAVAAIAKLVGNEAFSEALDLLLSVTGKVIVTGSGTSGTVARRMAHLLSVCGTPSLFLNPIDALHGSLGAIVTGDVVVAISKGGGTGELTDLITRARARGAKAMVLTSRDKSDLVDQADLAVVIPAGQGDPGDAMAMGSTFAMGAWGDALAISLMKLRGYSWEDFLFTHPGGRVGEESALILERVHTEE